MKRHLKIGRVLKSFIIGLSIAGAVQAVPAYAADSVHIAKKGDTFYYLAKQYGVDMNKLMEANPTVQPTNIYEGLKLQIPDEGAVSRMSTFSVDSAPSGQVVEAWGKTFTYTHTLDVRASAYSSAASENGKWGAVDYFGNPLQLGTIAVDPKVIPMGTKVLVTGHSHEGLPKDAFVATATDQGGAIIGNRIDIFIPGSPYSVKQFGLQDVKLYILD